MNVDKTLDEVRALALRFYDDRAQRLGQLRFDDARRMADLFLQLDHWLAHGGALPVVWLGAQK